MIRWPCSLTGAAMTNKQDEIVYLSVCCLERWGLPRKSAHVLCSVKNCVSCFLFCCWFFNLSFVSILGHRPFLLGAFTLNNRTWHRIHRAKNYPAWHGVSSTVSCIDVTPNRVTSGMEETTPHNRVSSSVNRIGSPQEDTTQSAMEETTPHNTWFFRQPNRVTPGRHNTECYGRNGK